MNVKSIIIACCTAAFLLVSAGVAGTAPAVAEPVVVEDQAQERTLTGTVEEKELNGKMMFVLNAGGQTYVLLPQDRASSFNGKAVTIKGKLEGTTVTISSIEEA
ncbi:MAG: hypothetical protein KIT83_09065 [Bryobacterales bacterium]|nr:hypothetical protein [Bryobacterales bacterium]